MAVVQFGGDRVVPARVVAQGVHGGEVFEKAGAGLPGRGGGAVKEDVFAVAVVGADADDVALLGADVDEFVLPVEAADGGVALAGFLPRLDGKADGGRIGKLEAGDGMRHPR